MIRKHLYATALSIIALAGSGIHAQSGPAQGNDSTNSMGSFKIYVNPNFINLFYHPNPSPAPPDICPGYDPSTNILSSPSPMTDGGTMIGRSDPFADGSNASPAFPAGPPSDLGGAPVGLAILGDVITPTTVSESMLIAPPGFPCAGVTTACSSGPGTPEIHTAVESLFLSGTYPNPITTDVLTAVVRAGKWYNSAQKASWPPARISPGEVESQNGPNATTFFKASSFFDIFVQVDMPKCPTTNPAFTKAFPSGTLYNLMPLVVKNNAVQTLPPQVVYLHDSSSIVPILFLNDDPNGLWHRDDILGYFLLVGHGVGMQQSDFDKFIGGQPNATCPIGSGTIATGTTTTAQSKSLQTASASIRGVKAASRRNKKAISKSNATSTSGGGGGGNR